LGNGAIRGAMMVMPLASDINKRVGGVPRRLEEGGSQVGGSCSLLQVGIKSYLCFSFSFDVGSLRGGFVPAVSKKASLSAERLLLHPASSIAKSSSVE
jgi:hypothetical protein